MLLDRPHRTRFGVRHLRRIVRARWSTPGRERRRADNPHRGGNGLFLSDFERFDAAFSADIDLAVKRARAMWRHASGKVARARVELYVKGASRLRAARDPVGSEVGFQAVNETGHAVRVIQPGTDSASFAAASGLTESALDWSLATATSDATMLPAVLPRAADLEQERFDLDEPAAIPSKEDLRQALLQRPTLAGIEAGTTLETLVGTEGWIAVRRRQRLWCVIEAPRVQVTAQRGFRNWQSRIDERLELPDLAPIEVGPGAFDFSPEAAAPLVTALVDLF